MTQLLPPKKEVALALLERSNVDVYLDPRARGVVVPPQFRKEPRLILKIGLNMPVPIPDLRVDEDSMSCTLSFNRSPFYCVVPWSSVFAMVGEDGRGMVWPDDVPQELAVKVVDEEGEGPTSPRAESPNGSVRRAPRKSPVAMAGADESPASAGGAGGPASEGKKGGARKKKPKKDEPARPMLAVVPSLPRSSPAAEPAPSTESADAGADVRTREPEVAAASARPASAPARPASASTPAAPAGPVAPSGAAPDRPRVGTGTGRPKRELPPYLRVVK
ncbi:MAG: Stringent starvation protein [Labilithrix sp.]|nr:Stringent starvation protein [Labilithrix sp.]